MEKTITSFKKVCPYCGEIFIFVSHSPMLKLLWETDGFIRDYKEHCKECSNAKLIGSHLE